MILSVLLAVLCLAIAFFQYIQGFFSATISAILAVIAAVVAVGYHESVANMLLAAKINDQAASVALVLVFAAVYVIPRFVFDKAVPGNVRFPVIMDKVGAGVMGLIAALMATGIVALAADALPFGPTIGMYSRFETVGEKPGMIIPENGQAKDVIMSEVVVPAKLEPENSQHLWMWQDDLVMAVANKLTNNGSLEGDRPIASIHPDYLDELYGQRLGIQVGAKHTLLNTAASPNADVEGLYTQPKLAQVDGVVAELRGGRSLPPILEPGLGQSILIIRTKLSGKDLGDSADTLFRFSAGSVRLCAGHLTDAGADFKDYHPVALLDSSNVAIACTVDDFLISDTNVDRTVDFVFVVDKDRAFGGESKTPVMADGSFLQIKRLAYLDLSGKKVVVGPPRNPDADSVIRMKQIQLLVAKAHPIPVGGGAGGESSSSSGGTQDASGVGVSVVGVTVGSKIDAKIGVAGTDAKGSVTSPPGVTGDYADKMWTKLNVVPTTAINQLAPSGTTPIENLQVNPGMVMVIAHCKAPSTADPDQNWQWAVRIGDFSVNDAGGNIYHPIGAWARVQTGAQSFFLASFRNMNGDRLAPIAQPPGGRPTDIWIAFEVFPGTPLTELHFGDATLNNALNLKIPAK